MTRSNLKILAIACVALVLVLIALQTNDDDTSAGGRLLFPELESDINEITSVTVTRSGDEEPTVIRRQADKWIVASRNDYTADVGKLRQLLLALADAKIVERKTSNAEYYGQLGVDDPAMEDSQGVLLELQGAEADYKLIVGNAAQAGYRYVRIADDSQSWLIDKNPQIPASAGDWLLGNIVDIKSAAVRSVTISHPDGEEIRIGRESAETSDFDVLNIPDGRELSYDTVANGIAGALNALNLDDVRKGDAFEADVVTTTFDTFDGTRIVVETMKSDDGNWISLRAIADDQDVAAEGVAEDGEKIEGEAAVDVESAAEINARVEGWQYRIPEYKANQLTRRFEDILKAESAE